jgi:anti-sigma regulatory factor (Ser/Thr protein kinase)
MNGPGDRIRKGRERLGRVAGAPFGGDDAASARELDFTIEDLGRVRALVAEAASMTALDADRSADLVLAVNELATNSICHGGGHGTLRMWCSDHALLCEVRDAGQIPAEAAEPPRDRPDPDAMSGRGLWLVDQLCDAVQISSSPDAGSAVRVRMHLP